MSRNDELFGLDIWKTRLQKITDQKCIEVKPSSVKEISDNSLIEIIEKL